MPTSLNAGDIAIIGINSDNPDTISFVALTDLSKDTEIKFTDNGVTSTGTLRANEGTWVWTADQNIAAGSIITLTGEGGVTASLGSVSSKGSLALSASGDQVIAYQGEETAPNFIYAVNFEGTDWQEDATSSNTSALPKGLEAGKTAVAIIETDNAQYQGSTTGSKEALLTAISQASNWQGDDNTRFEQPTGSFVLGNTGTDITAPLLLSSNPVDNGTLLETNNDIIFTFNEAVQAGTGYITLTDASNTVIETFDVAQSDRVSFVDNTLTIDPTNDLQANTSYKVTINDAAITDSAGNAWAVNFGDTTPTVLDFTTLTPQATDYTYIHDIQGVGNNGSQAYLGKEVTIDAIVTAYVPGMNGFYVQEQPTDYDLNDATSEGIFVHYGTNNPGVTMASIGDTVTLSGLVAEYYNNTQITYTQGFNVTRDGTVSDLPEPVTITLPTSDSFDFETVEGMYVNIKSGSEDGSLVVTETYNLGRYGEVVLTSDEVQVQYTETNEPSVEGNRNYLDAIAHDRIIIEDANIKQNPDSIIFGRNGEPLSESNTLRGGDSVAEINGVVNYSFGNYKIQPIDGKGYNFTGEERPTAEDLHAKIGDAEVTVASANVLNFFTTFGNSKFETPYGNEQSGRGADNLEEYNRQLDKLVSMIQGLDADVVGLMEIQNNGYGEDSAIKALVDAINARLGADTYDYIKGPFNNGSESTAGNDAIMVGMIYKPANVTPVGSAVVPDTDEYPAFANGNRVPLAQAFESNKDGEQFSVVVNHFKSKGSVIDPDQQDGQGNNPITRLEAAQQLKQWMDTDPTGTGDTDNVLIGDFNSYTMEDSLQYLENSGYDIQKEGFSYVFDGLWGSLDHVITSESMSDQITGVATWGINAEEATAFDYNTNFKGNGQKGLYAPDAYRASDHNPVLIGLNLNQNEKINTAPQVSDTLDNQVVTTGDKFELVLTDNLFNDADGDELSYQVTLADGSSLPEWLSFDAESNTISGTAPQGENITLKVIATDPNGAQAEQLFELATNARPQVNQAIDSVLYLSASDNDWQYKLPQNAFTDADNDVLTYKLSMVDGSDVPAGLSIDVSTGEITADATQLVAHGYRGSAVYDIQITAVDDDGLEVSSATKLVVDDSVINANGCSTIGSWSDDIIVAQNDDSHNIYGLIGNDLLIGGNGKDSLIGGLGNDELVGHGGNDCLDGGIGNDILVGGNGNDTLKGGLGDDTYVFTKGDGKDLIMDLSGNDTLDLTSFTLSDIVVDRHGSDLVIQFDGQQANNNDSITIQNWNMPLLGSYFHIETIQLADTVLSDTQRTAMIGQP